MKKILIIYIITFFVLTAYSYLKVKECVAYWMHDAAIDVKHNNILYFCIYSFIFPMLLLYFSQRFNKEKTILNMFIFQYLFALLSILSLFVSIINPLKSQIVDNINYVFTSSSFTLSYYFFKLLNFILLLSIVLKFIYKRMTNYKLTFN